MRVLNRVSNILHRSELARNSDKQLLLMYWQEQGLELSTEQQATFLLNCTGAEAVTRARRRLRTKYPASTEVEVARQERAKEYQHSHAVSWLEEENA